MEASPLIPNRVKHVTPLDSPLPQTQHEMFSLEILCLIVHITGVALVLQLSIPALQHFIVYCSMRRKEYMRYYGQTHDAEKAPEFPEEPRTISETDIRSYLLVGLGAFGCICAFFRAAISNGPFVVEPWLQLAIWVFILSQYVTLTLEPLCTPRYALGLKGGLSCCIAALIMLVERYSEPDQGGAQRSPLIQLLFPLLAIIILISLSIPRRPRTYRNGRPIGEEGSSSIMNHLCFHWASPLIEKAGSSPDIELNSLPELNDIARSKSLQDAFCRALITYRSASSLWKILLSLYRKHLIYQTALSIPLALLAFTPHLALGEILLFLEARSDREPYTAQLLSWSIVLGLGIGLSAWLENWLLWVGQSRISTPMGQQLCAVLFDKTMRLSSHAENSMESGLDVQNVINLAAIDAPRIAAVACYFYCNLLQLMKLAVACTLLGRLLGWQSLLTGISCLLLLSPLHSICLKKCSAVEYGLMTSRDLKMAAVSEALHGIRQVKFSAHEKKWEAKLNRLRDNELNAQRRAFHWQVVSLTLHLLGPVLVSTIALGIHGHIYGQLVPSVAFPALSILGYLQFILGVIPELLSGVMAARVSIQRVEAYLKAYEQPKELLPGKIIQLEAVTMAYRRNISPGSPGTLHDVTINFPPYGLSLVSGPTGSGKSLLLAGILGECEILSGRVQCPESSTDLKMTCHTHVQWVIGAEIAYVAQTPWIEAGTIRENILFGVPLDTHRYKTVLYACALIPDLATFEDSDLTDIGPSGVNLSGGQKARISLARALYSRAGILVLDDIFSAVDVHTAKHVLEHALTGELAKGRTRILVTHNVGLCLAKTDYLVHLENGTVSYAGKVPDLKRQGLIVATADSESTAETAMAATLGKGSLELPLLNFPEAGSKLAISQNRKKYVKEETRQHGAVQWPLIKRYIDISGGWSAWSVLAVCYIAYNSLLLVQYWWMNIWSGSEDATKDHPDTWFYLKTYMAIAVMACVVGALRSYIALTLSLHASTELFRQILHTILRAPLQWLDTVPVGRLLNRFTADFYLLDSRLGLDLTALLNAGMDCVGVIMGAVLVRPILILFAAALVSAAFWYTRQYLAAAREVKRLECIARSPVYQHFSSSLQGLVTIRAFRRTHHFIANAHAKIDEHAKAVWHLALFTQWFTFRINALGALFSTVTALAVVCRRDVTGSMAGFALVFTNHLCFALVSLSRTYATVEMDLNAVERVLEYSNIPTEDEIGEDVSSTWPTDGRLEVRDLTVGYSSDSLPVLTNVSFTVNPRQRIGIVGRTGAGKSSLALALFRFLDPRQGGIRIDGIDISSIKLDHLRSRLAMIPQNPVLFSGSVRSNLDPFGEHGVDTLVQALKHVHWEIDESCPRSVLDASISKEGSNLSHGQRQLLCLARAMLAKPAVLILDEATSAVDRATDELIQRSIRSDFCRSTLLVIAHRIQTVADFDKVLVLENGGVVEYGTPRELMKKNRGYFRQMVESDTDRRALERLICGKREL